MTNLAVRMNIATARPAANDDNNKHQTFEIILDDDVSNGETVYPGEELHGNVKLVVSKETQFTRLHVAFKGQSSTYTSWMRKYSVDLTANDCGASEVYFNDDLVLFDNGRCLEKGTHLFPFKFTVPSGLNLPASFEGGNGHVRYFVAAQLDRALYAKRRFNMVGEQRMMLDQNCLLSALAPVSGSGNKKISRLCCLSSHISLYAETDKKEYKPGESILLSGTLDNRSGHQIPQMTLALKQKALYANCATEYPSGESQKVLVEEVFDISCSKSSKVTFTNKPLVVPRCCPPSGLPGCGIIDIEYCVSVEAEASVRLAVDIGTHVHGKTMVMEYDSGDVDNSKLTTECKTQSEESLVLTTSPYMALLGDCSAAKHSDISQMVTSDEHRQYNTRSEISMEDRSKTTSSLVPPVSTQMTQQEDSDNQHTISCMAGPSKDDSPLLLETSPIEDLSLKSSTTEDISLKSSTKEDISPKSSTIDDVSLKSSTSEDIPLKLSHIKNFSLQLSPPEDISLKSSTTEDVSLKPSPKTDAISLQPPRKEDVSLKPLPIKDISLEPQSIPKDHERKPLEEHINPQVIPSYLPSLDGYAYPSILPSSGDCNPRASIIHKTSLHDGTSARSSVTFSIPGQCLIRQPITSAVNSHRKRIVSQQLSNTTTSNASHQTSEGAVANLQNIQNQHSHTVMNIDKAFASLGNHKSHSPNDVCHRVNPIDIA